MLGLNVYSYVEDTDVQFYKGQRATAKKMDILDWIPGGYVEEIVENPMDRARRVVVDESALTVQVLEPQPQPLMQLDPGSSSRGIVEMGEEEEEDEEMEKAEGEAEGELEEGATGFTQESEAPQRKKALTTATPQSKLVPALTVADALEMYSRDATATFRERRKLKGKKLYGDYAGEETIAISSEDEDDFELGKRLREEPTGPRVIASNINPKPETLTVEEANRRADRMRLEEEHRAQLARAAAEEPSVRDEVAQLKALVLMMAQGFRAPAPAALPQQPPQLYYPPSGSGSSSSPYQGMMPPPPPQYYPPSGPGSSSSPFQGMMHPPTHHYAPVQQVDDPHLWRQGTPGSSRPLTPPPLRPPLIMPPPHQQDDPRMFGPAGPNTAAPALLPVGPPVAGEFDTTMVDETVVEDDAMVDAEGPQGPGDASTPNPVDEPMHDAHAEVGLGQRPDSQPLHEQVAAEERPEDRGDSGGPAQEDLPSTAARPDQGEVMY